MQGRWAGRSAAQRHAFSAIALLARGPLTLRERVAREGARLRGGQPFLWSVALFVVLLTLTWRFLELDSRWLSIVITAMGLVAAAIGAAPLLAWLTALLQFHPATYASLVDVAGVAIAPFDLGLVFLVIRFGLGEFARSDGRQLVMGHLRTLRTPLTLLGGFVLWASASLLFATQLFSAETLITMWVTFLKLLQWPALFLLLVLILRPRVELRGDILRLVAGLGGAQAAYAVVAALLRMYFLIEITPAALHLPAEVADLPLYPGWGPFAQLFESRATSLIGGPPVTAMLAAVSGFLSFFFARSATSSGERIAWSSAVVACLAATVLTLTRTSWLALAVAAPVLLFAPTRRDKLAYLVLVASAALAVLPAYPILSGRVLDVVDPAGLAVTSRLLRGEPTVGAVANDASALRTERPVFNAKTGEIVVTTRTTESLGERSTLNLRLGTWLLGLHYITERPLFGYGWSASGYLVDDGFLRALFPTLTREYFVSNAGSMHNIYLDLAVGTGLIGLALFLTFVLSVLIAMWKSLWHAGIDYRLTAISLSACFVYLAVAGLGDSWLSAGNPVGWILWFLMAEAVIVGFGAASQKQSTLNSHGA